MPEVHKLEAVPSDPEAGGGQAAWLSRGQALRERDRLRSWEMADWAAEGVAGFGAPVLTVAAEALGMSVRRARFLADVGARFPSSRWRPVLPAATCMEVLSLPEAEGDRILQAAEAGRWTKLQVRAAAREASLATRLEEAEAENRRLRDLLDLAHAGPEAGRAVVARYRVEVENEDRTVRKALDRLAGAAEDVGASAAYRAAHGNARLASRRHALETIERLGAAVQESHARVARALAVA